MNRILHIILLTVLVLPFSNMKAQTVIGTYNAENQGNKILTMEDTMLNRNIYPQNKYYQWVGDQDVYVKIESDKLEAYNVDKKKSYTFMTLEEVNKILGTEFRMFPRFTFPSKNIMNIYSADKYYVININTKNLVYSVKVPKAVDNFNFAPAISPDGTQYFSYTIDNNLFICNKDNKVQAVTSDENPDIVNGQTVSRNEFGISQGIFWSPDASLLAYYRKDNSDVGDFPLLDITAREAKTVNIKYPMAGMPSEHITLGIYNPKTFKTVFCKVTDFDNERYLTNISWTPDSKYILIQVLNRAQKHVKLNMYSAETGEYVKTLLEEENDRFVEPLDKLIFLKNNSSKFIYRTDNRDGYKNLYLCSLDGNIERLTKTDADVAYVGQDHRYVYYTSAEVSPVETHLFKVDMEKGKVYRLTSQTGWHSVSLSANCKYFIDKYSNVNTPRVITLMGTRNRKKDIKPLFTAPNPVKEFNYGEVELGSTPSADKRFTNYYRLIKPANFDPNKKYPLIIYVYGGPHSQMVQNKWLGNMRNWEMYMAQRGYVVYVQDNRGTQNQGAEFEKAIHGQCGQKEMEDQILGIKKIMALSYVDENRVGVHGWSYGGFMTISLTTNYPEIFKVAVAGGPVVDWKWYEIMYGERYMDDPRVNPEGYAKVSLLNKAKDLKSKLLICQGVIDNTVVWQHSLSFVRECVMNNVQLDYFPYPRHPHNVRGKDRVHLMNKISMYFDDYLKNAK
ncbi:MAG: DPP IV N-terminal domain-containing protein [Bacteroidales bacterium]